MPGFYATTGQHQCSTLYRQKGGMPPKPQRTAKICDHGCALLELAVDSIVVRGGLCAIGLHIVWICTSLAELLHDSSVALERAPVQCGDPIEILCVDVGLGRD